MYYAHAHAPAIGSSLLSFQGICQAALCGFLARRHLGLGKLLENSATLTRLNCSHIFYSHSEDISLEK
jgi:hypothetical protein